MRIKLITVGKIKEAYLKKGIETYLKKIRQVSHIDLVSLADEMTPDHASHKLNQKILDKEGARILDKVQDHDYVISLEIEGSKLTSQQFKKMLQTCGDKTVVFIIGGSLGLSDAVKNRSNKAISFSDMTFPHQLMQLILVEQISRII